jgi:glycosyltransferase involved in cell wall biosynthesis
MRILLAVHYFLPRHQAGTELYTRALARQFKKSGHEVFIFASEDQSGSGFKLGQDDYEGIPVHRLYHSYLSDFKASYSRPDFDRVFGETLDKVRPDVIHFQHLFRLSTGFVEEAKKRKIPALLTLADYWLICPAIIMLKPELALCKGPEEGRACANCPHAMSAFLPASESSWLWKGLETGISYGHKLKRKLPPKMVDSLREMLGKKNELEQKLSLMQERWKEIKKAVDGLDLLISPSKFLRQMLIESRVCSEEKIIFSDYGFEAEGFAEKTRPARAGNQDLRVGFIGTLVRHKGVHTLLEAARTIPQEKIELKIFGEPKDFPGYVRSLKKLAGKDPRIKWMGRVEHDRVNDALAGIDLLVVPSLWYENSPLTIHEAFMAGVPVLAGNIGGMKELVEEGGGMLFDPGNYQDLAEKIKSLNTDPAKLEQLRKSIPVVKTIDQNCQELMLIYQMLKK